MGSGFSAMFEPFQSVAKSIGDGLKGIKLPDNPLKDVSLGNKGRNFIKGVSSGITGPKQVRVQVRTDPFGLGSTTQMRFVSSTPMSVSGIAGDFLGDKISRMGRTGTKPIFSSSNKPSFVERMKQKIKPTKTTNIGNIELSNMSQQPQPPQEIQQAGKKKKSSKKETTLSKREKKPSKKETTSHKKEKNPSKNEKKPSKKEKKPSENKKKPK